MTLITNKDLIDLVSEQSKHYKYVVEDVLYALAIVISEQVDLGNDVKLKGLGVFSYKPPRRITNFSPYSGRYMDKYTKRTCKFKPDVLFLNKLNEEG
jgi:nucleoid DNA-binding protein